MQIISPKRFPESAFELAFPICPTLLRFEHIPHLGVLCVIYRLLQYRVWTSSRHLYNVGLTTVSFRADHPRIHPSKRNRNADDLYPDYQSQASFLGWLFKSLVELPLQYTWRSAHSPPASREILGFCSYWYHYATGLKSLFRSSAVYAMVRVETRFSHPVTRISCSYRLCPHICTSFNAAAPGGHHRILPLWDILPFSSMSEEFLHRRAGFYTGEIVSLPRECSAR
jgi:hypothetical protein